MGGECGGAQQPVGIGPVGVAERARVVALEQVAVECQQAVAVFVAYQAVGECGAVGLRGAVQPRPCGHGPAGGGK